MFTKDEIINYADKLLIGLTDKEANDILMEFDEINRNIDRINNIPDLKNYEPASMPYDLYEASLREDEICKSLDIDEILANTKDYDGREVKTPKVVGNE